jgi:GNAT superfamily N-acetyltransferase
MAKCSLPYIEKRFRDSNPQLADKLNAIGLKVFEDISNSNLFARKSGNFMFNKLGTKKRVSQNEFVSKLNTDLGAEVVREIESKVSVNVLPLASEQEMAAVSVGVVGGAETKQSPLTNKVFKFLDKVFDRFYDEGNPLELKIGKTKIEVGLETLASGDESILLGDIFTEPESQGKGEASKVLKAITDYADKNDTPISLRASSGGRYEVKGLSQEDLIKFYQKNGFELSPDASVFGRDEIFMVREPKTVGQPQAGIVGVGGEEFKYSEELPNSFITLSDFEEPAYTPTTPETHPERKAPLAPEPIKSIPQQWAEYESLKDRTDLTPDEELDLAVYRAKFDMFDTPSQYEKVMSDPTSKPFVSFREKKLEELLLRFADKFGITIANIEDFQKQYFEKTGKFIPANGVANLFEKVIYVSEGNTDALTEEVAHFIIAMLPKDGELYQNLKQYISRTKEYELFYDKYLAQYEGDVDKTEEEIMGKVFKNALQDKEETMPLSVKSVVKRIINYISDLFSDDRTEYLDSLNQLKKMFFAENLAEGLDAANINYDELYQLNFEITGKNNSVAELADRSKKFDLGANLLIENLEDTLFNIRQQAIESNQAEALKTSNYLLSILGKKTEQDADKAKILSSMVFSSVSTIRRLQGSFNEFDKLNIPETLETEFNRDNLMKLSYDDYNKSLSKLASYINYLQSLYSLSKSIESTSKLMKLESNDMIAFKKIIYALDPSITENDEIIKAFNLLEGEGVAVMTKKIESLYLKNVKQILDIYMSALSTEDQKRFLEYQNEAVFANTDAKTIADKNNNKIEYSKGIFSNIKSLFSKGITPVTMQNDTFIQSVDRFVWAMEQMGKERASKEVAEVQKIENRLYQNGANAQNQDWLSEKDDKGRSTGNLITKLNFSKYANLAAKNLKDKLRKLPFASNDNIKALQKIDFNSPKQVFDSLGELLKDNKITQEEFDKAKNYLMAEKALYDLEHTNPNYTSTTLSSNSLDALRNYIDRNIVNVREALNDPNFDWENDEIELISDDFGDLESALEELIAEKRALLEEKYFTVDEDKRVLLKADGTPDLDKNGNEKLNPIYKTELDFVEALLNKYKYKIGYTTDTDGNFYPEKINIDVWGDEFLFELSDSHPDAKNYTNKDYLELEDKAANGDALALAKMDMVNYIKKWNKQNNLPSNFLPKGAKKDSEYLQMFGNKRFINIFGVNFDVAKIITQVVIPFAGVANTPMLFGIAAGLVNPLTLGVSSMIFSYFFYNRIANQAVKFISIYGDTYGRINDTKGLKRFAVALAKSLGVYNKALQFELNKDDSIISTGEPEKSELWLKKMFYKIFKAVDQKQANKKNKIDVIPRKYTEYIEPALRSTQYLDNFKSFIYANKEYENKSMYEGAIRAMNDLYRKREDKNGNIIGDDYLESIYIDRYWYNKIYPNSFEMKFMRVLAAQTGFNQLTGNLNTGVKNILTGISMISANGGLLATMPAIKDATIYSFNMMILARGKNSRVALEQNKIQMIKKHLRSSSFGGIVDFDYSDSSLVQKLRLNNAQIVSDLGESFISSVLVYKFLRDTKLIDENGKKIDIIKHLTIKDGRLSLDDKAPKNIYFNNINEIQSAEDLQLDPGYVKDINLRAIVPKNLQKEALVPLEIDVYLNRTLLQNIDYFRQRSQGVYNILLKPRVSTTAIGTALFMYQHYVLPGVYTAFGRKKNNPNLEGSEEGFIITLAKALKRGAITNRFKDKLSPDSVNNIMRINNIKTKGLLEDLGGLANVYLYFSKNKNIVTQSLLDAAEEQEKAIKFAEEQDAIVAQGGERKEGPAYYAGFKGKNKEEIFKELLIEANKQRRLNEYEATNYKKVASILAMYFLLKAALKFAYPPLEEDEIATYMASVSEVVSSELFRTWVPISEGRLGFSWNLDPAGRRANEGFLSWDFTKISPLAGNVNDLAKNMYWSGSVGLYKLTGIVPFSQETGNKLIDVTGGEIPLMKTKYSYDREGYVTGEVNVAEENLKDFLIGNRLRDALRSSELRQKKYLDMPTGELANMIYKLQNGYYKAYGRNLEEEIKPTEE